MSVPERVRAFCAVLHDVAPQTWGAYGPFVALADRLGVPLTLLVVPDFHHDGDLRHHPDFVAALDARLARGDEIALHGYFHADDAPLRGDPVDYLMRRIYTHEAEFYRLDAQAARARLEHGLDLFAGFGWHPAGFVAPAWLLNDGTYSALTGLPLRYTSTVRELIDLRSGRGHRAPALTWSARSAWRRGLSRAFNSALLRLHQDVPLLRLGLHPVDMRHASASAFWADTVQQLLTCREPMTKSTWLDEAA
jgi:predicted deacetylase